MTIRLLNLLSVLVIVTTVSSVKFKDWMKLHQVKYKPQEKEIRQAIEYEIIGEGSQICRYCLRRKGHKSQLLAGEGSQISLF